MAIENDEVEFVPWGEIELFHNLIKLVAQSRKIEDTLKDEEDEDGISLKYLNEIIQKPITFKGKVKLHGSNGGVTLEGTQIKAQSRNQFITGTSGFARIVFGKNEEYFKSLITTPSGQEWKKFTIFGEHCGPKIQRGVALTKLKEEIFAVFAIDIGGELIIEPGDIERFMTKQGTIPLPPTVFILPWHTDEIHIDLIEALEHGSVKVLAGIEQTVQEIDQLDPWVLKTFGIEGPGEGLVLYPVSLVESSDITTEYKTLKKETFRRFAFKAKGEKHRVVATKTSLQVNPTVAHGVEAYVNLMCPEARLQQGAGEVGGYEMSKIKRFIQWITKDVQKEGKAELEVSGLEWKDVTGALTKKASAWYAQRVKQGKSLATG